MDLQTLYDWGLGGVIAAQAVLFWLVIRHEKECKEFRIELREWMTKIDDRLAKGAAQLAVLEERTTRD